MSETYCATGPFFIYIHLSNGLRRQMQLQQQVKILFVLRERTEQVQLHFR